MKFLTFEAARKIQAKDHALWVYPTDTLYALGGIASATVAQRINQIKGRPSSKSLSVLIPNIDWAIQHLSLPKSAIPRIEQRIGAYTLIVKKRCISDFYWLSPTAHLGIRLLKKTHPAQQWANQLQQPIIATSANFTGEGSAMRAQQINPLLLEQVDHRVQGDELLSGKASTLWDFEHDCAIKRP